MVLHHSTLGSWLDYVNTGAEDRLHDCRARNVVEAIMWHCYDKRSDAYNSAINFYNATKEERDAVVAFINAILSLYKKKQK